MKTPPRRRTPAERRERPKRDRPSGETPDTNWRLFIAVPIPTDVQERIRTIIASTAESNLPVRWVNPENTHITLHFIGETPPEMAELLRMTLPAAINAHAPFTLRTAEPGAFPSIRQPRVLWLGLWGPAHRLEALFNDIGDFLDDFGLEIEETEFHPHITLGRMRDTEGVRIGSLPDQVRALFSSLIESGWVGGEHALNLPVTEVQLIRSHLGKEGSSYEILGTYPLEGNDD